MQIFCRCSVGLQDLLKCIPVVAFLGKKSTNFRINWCRFCSVHKVGGAQPPGFKLGVLKPPKPPPRSYVPGKEVCIFLVDALPIGLQDLKYIFFGGGGMLTKFRITFGAYFFPYIKLRGLSPPVFKLGGARAPAAPPGSYVPA